MTNGQIPMTNGGKRGKPPSVFERTCIPFGHWSLGIGHCAEWTNAPIDQAKDDAEDK
jgi:hypothetical protein